MISLAPMTRELFHESQPPVQPVVVIIMLLSLQAYAIYCMVSL